MAFLVKSSRSLKGLRGTAARFLTTVLVLAGSCLWASDIENLTLAPGFEVEEVFVAGPLTNPGAMDLDPLSGDLFVDNTGGVNPSGTTGHIARINLSSGATSVLIPVSNGYCLGFAPDGTLYFSVSNYLLARWDRKSNTFRKFSIIPGLRGIDFDDQGGIFVAAGSYGPRGLYPDTLLKVDQRTGYFKPVFHTDQASATTGTNFNGLASMALSDGTLYAVYKSGQVVVKQGETYVEGNSTHDSVGGLNQAPLYSYGDTVLHYDIGGGHLYAIIDGQVRLLAYGRAIRGSLNDTAGVTSDGSSIYICGDYNRILRIKPVAGNVAQTLRTSLPEVLFSGTVLDVVTGEPVVGASVDLKNGLGSVTADDGSFAFNAPASLYEVTVSREGYLASYADIDMSAGPLNKDLSATTGLPTWLAPGLAAEVWAAPSDGIVYATDALEDSDGNVYAMSIGGARITKHLRDPLTGAHLSAHEFAFGPPLAGSWTLAIDAENNVYASNSNDGVLRLPPLPEGESHQLIVAPGDVTSVRNQKGESLSASTARDVDGIGFLSDGSLLMTSGSGGDPSPPCFPDGTIDTLLRQAPGAACPQILSRGIPCEGGENVIANPDILRVDAQDRIWFANSTGNVVRVDSQTGCVDWWLPGDGAGIEEHRMGSYTAVTPSPDGQVFLRGVRAAPEDNVIRIHADGKFYMVVGGTRQCFGGLAFPNSSGSELIYSDGDTLIRVYSLTGEAIADVVKSSVTAE